MVDFFYDLLQKIGYTHPPHAPLTHLPNGLVISAFILGVIALLFKRSNLAVSARHCLVIAFIFFFPVVLLGYMDWQRFFAGAWLFPIKMKIIFSGVLFVLLSVGLGLDYLEVLGPKSRLAIYTVCVFAVIALGYYGGQMVLGGKCPEAPPELAGGARLYETYCGGCHPNGGNILNPKLSVIGAPQLKDFDTFLTFNRRPRRPDGSSGIMPAFPPKKLSDQQMQELYHYIFHAFIMTERKR